MPYRIIIADDQDASRKVLQQMIEKIGQDDFEIVDVAEDGVELVEKVILKQPDLVLCDIEMPYKKGIDAMKECRQAIPSLAFIFTTAHDAFAVEAFDIYAVDYVLKPIQLSRLHMSLERAKNVLGEPQAKHPPTTKKKYNRIPIRHNRSLYYIQIDDILFIEKSDRKAIIHTNYEQYSSSETLEYFLEYLDERFELSHRSFIINLAHISHIQTSGKSYMVYFHGYGEPAQISKQNIQRIQQVMIKYL